MVKIDVIEYNTTCPDEAGTTIEVKENIHLSTVEQEDDIKAILNI